MVDQVYNQRNGRFLQHSTPVVTGVFRTKHPALKMVLGIVGSDVKKIPPYFFKQGEKIGADVHYRVLRYTALPYGAPAHTAKKNQKFRERRRLESVIEAEGGHIE